MNYSLALPRSLRIAHHEITWGRLHVLVTIIASLRNAAQLRDDVVERRRSGRRRSIPPELVDERVSRHDGARAQQQEREQRTLKWPAERHGRLIVEHLERAQDPELEHSSVVTPVTTLSKPG